jgi:hypothetical protein
MAEHAQGSRNRISLSRSRISRFLRAAAAAAAAALLLFASLPLTGCDGGSGNNPGGTTPGATAPVESPTAVPDGSQSQALLEPYKGLIISKVYGNSAKKDAVTEAGFIELYNSSNADISLGGLALYYKTLGSASYYQFAFDSGATVKAGGYFLVKCAGSDKYDRSYEVISLDAFDAFWNVKLDNKEISLLLTLAGMEPDPAVNPAEIKIKLSYFCATESFYFDTGVVDDMSKSKYAVRTMLIEDSGWQLVNLTKANSAKLRQIVPRSSKGPAGTVKQCAINEVDFSVPAGFYSEPQSVELTAREGYEIFYTLDGTDPKESETRKLYNAPIALADSTSLRRRETVKTVALTMGGNYAPSVSRLIGGYSLRACSKAPDGTYSEVFTSTYFISSAMKEFGVNVIAFSLPVDDMVGEEGFYNHYYPSDNIPNPRGQACFEFFDTEGTRRGYSNVELSVSGHGSSGAPMKSLKLFFRKELNQTGGYENKLYYDAFDGYSVNSKGQRITEFSRLLIRNSGNDCGMTYIRDSYMQRACRNLNIDTMAYAPVLVFFNGEFWGVYNLRERYTGQYVESHYGIDADNVAVIESDYSQVHTNQNADYIVMSGTESDAQPFNDLVLYMRTHDLKVEKYFNYVAARIDLDSFIDMYVARQFFNSLDWPENNIKVWRNRAGDADPSHFDTKWHFTLLDLDFGCAYYDFTDYEASIMHTLHSTNCVIGSMMHALIENDAFRARFQERFYRVCTEILTPENLTADLDIIVEGRKNVIELQKKRWNASVSNYETGVESMRNFAQNRSKKAIKFMCDAFGLDYAQFVLSMGNGLTVSYQAGRCTVFINGEKSTEAMVASVEAGKVFKVDTEARGSYEVVSIAYTDLEGNVIAEVAGTSAEFTFIKSGVIVVTAEKKKK